MVIISQSKNWHVWTRILNIEVVVNLFVSISFLEINTFSFFSFLQEHVEVAEINFRFVDSLCAYCLPAERMEVEQSKCLQPQRPFFKVIQIYTNLQHLAYNRRKSGTRNGQDECPYIPYSPTSKGH